MHKTKPYLQVLLALAVLFCTDTAFAQDEQSCDNSLIADALGQKLEIEIPDSGRYGGELLDLVCKAHPLFPTQTIAALFFDVKDGKGNYRDDGKGFVIALIDTKKRTAISVYRDFVEHDSPQGIVDRRIDQYSLSLDTGKYDVAPGVRAIGVRMAIGHSPCAGDSGSSDFLTLFVRRDRRLVPILREQAMSAFERRDVVTTCNGGQNDLTLLEAKASLQLAKTQTNGMRDIELWVKIQMDATSTIKSYAEADIAKREKLHRRAVLRFDGTRYASVFDLITSED